jgi:glycosyltransferase involved in cell wall biosynthesis
VFYDNLAGKVIHNAAKGLTDLGHDVRIISPIPFAPFPLTIFKSKWKNYANVPVHVEVEGLSCYHPRYILFPSKALLNISSYLMYLGIAKISKELITKYDIDCIHSHNLFPDGYSAMCLAKKYNKKYFITVRGTDIDINVNATNSIKRLASKILINADKVISPSHQISIKLKTIFGVDSKVIENGVEKTFHNVNINENADIMFKGSKVILSVSRLLESKGVHYNIAAICRLVSKYPKLLYVIIGEGPFRDDLEKMVYQFNLQEKVIFLGQLTHQEVKKYITACDIFSLPSTQETFGLVYVEAMLEGKPVICCSGQGIDGLIKNGISGILVSPNDVDDLVGKIEYLIQNAEVADLIGIRGKCIAQNLTWENHVDKLLNVYMSSKLQ